MSYMYTVGDRFQVIAASPGDGDANINKIGIFIGTVSVHDNKVTHLWLVFSDSGGAEGYPVENLVYVMYNDQPRTSDPEHRQPGKVDIRLLPTRMRTAVWRGMHEFEWQTVNDIDESALYTLRNVGEVTANRILEWAAKYKPGTRLTAGYGRK